MQQSGRPTIKDVARAAGVSPTTVSHALNGKGVVRRETVERIERVATEVGYRPSAIARGLQKSRLGLLALVIRPFHSLDTFLPEGVDYFLRVAGAASLSAMEHGYSMMLIDDPTRPGVPFSALAADAYIVTEPFENDPVLTLLSEQRIPFVTLGADPARRGEFPAIDEGADQQTLLMISHLAEAGAQRIALVTGTDRNDWNLGSKRSLTSWSEARGQRPLVLALPEAAGERVGDAVIDHFFGGDPSEHPDAVFCLTGRHAAGVAEAAIRRGIRVPEDLLVAAGSGAMQNRTSSPTVTTLDLHPEESAQLAVEVAVRLAEGRPIDTPIAVPAATLDIRESTTRA
ncbi:LacI family DNA-binding transcriptional regulator [Leucobacter sp. wl10]|uniref:LacI family DNA-binding transcriptional regulator n=1 Tax=Leucobacter sp. wl10 TaxID=2304677 RepID=UPI001F0A01C5|nr:LacI family DNA-binding transcriptional regulator [Leucobacter sp. wl10]